LDDINPYYNPLKRFFGKQGGRNISERLPEKTEKDLEEDTSTSPLQRRDRHEIIAEILKTAKPGKKKTDIMYTARLSHSQLKLYLRLLSRTGMIVNKNGVYVTTPKGLTFVREFESINFLFRH
jgi:predicted transcriptional regulator